MLSPWPFHPGTSLTHSRRRLLSSDRLQFLKSPATRAGPPSRRSSTTHRCLSAYYKNCRSNWTVFLGRPPLASARWGRVARGTARLDGGAAAWDDPRSISHAGEIGGLPGGPCSPARPCCNSGRGRRWSASPRRSMPLRAAAPVDLSPPEAAPPHRAPKCGGWGRRSRGGVGAVEEDLPQEHWPRCRSRGGQEDGSAGDGS